MTTPDPTPEGFHVGRSFSGHVIEDECPCRQEACGLVDPARAHPDCPHHPVGKCRTIRQGHPASFCPGDQP